MASAMRGIKVDETQVSIGQDDRGLVLDLDAGTFFDPNSAALKPEFLPALLKIAATLQSEKFSAFQIEVQGHTDDDKPNSPAYPTNWELSAARATAVVRKLIDDGVQADRLGAVGYADTRPRVANRDVNGNALSVNQAINRRVSIHIYPR
jgi:chemotaxis protein MotB